jgi:hypothetical protein
VSQPFRFSASRQRSKASSVSSLGGPRRGTAGSVDTNVSGLWVVASVSRGFVCLIGLGNHPLPACPCA